MLRGRLMIYVGWDHPMIVTQPYVMEHRLVLAEALGRWLTSDEHVHHLDFDETNNAVENLIVLDNSQHKRLHRMVDLGTDAMEALRIVSGLA